MIDLRGLVAPGDSVLWGQGPAQPRALVRALLAQQDELGPLRGVVGTIVGDLAPEALAAVDLTGFIGSGPASRLRAAGRLDVVPSAVSDIPRLFERGLVRVDVVLVQVSPPDDRGRHSLGLAGDYLREAIAAARTVVAEVNPGVPFTLGDSLVDGSSFAAVVESREPPLEVPSAPPDAIRRRLGANAARLIEDGSVIQIGIGATPDAVVDTLRGHRDLGVHSGMITDRIAELMDAGAINNRRKELDRGRTVTGTLFGTAAGLYAFADRNRSIELRPISYTHDLGVLRRLRRFVAINGAIEVDLAGQVNTEIAAGRYVGAVGGQLDFARGALAAPEGRSIVALASTAGAAGPSRIVARIEAGRVAVPASCTDAVVTEHGVAELRGVPLRERARRLIAIADPRHQADLERAAAG